MTVQQGESLTIEIQADQTLTVTAAAGQTGKLTRLGDSSGQQSQSVSTIAVSTTTTFGPYGKLARFHLNCTAGVLTYTVQKATPLTQTLTDVMAAVTATAAEINKLAGAGAVVASGTAAANIADPTGGATQDAEARTAIASILDALEAFGIAATS